MTDDISLSLGSKIRVFIEGDYNAELEIRRTGKLIELRDFNYLPRWIDIDSGVEWWNYQLKCKNCYLSRPAVVVYNMVPTRNKRSSDKVGKTDCKVGRRKRTCCRHQMQVVFNQLPGYQFVQQPFSFDAGYCKGGCPYKFNHANHHAHLQDLIRWLNKNDAPKLCCAPSKLEPLQIIHLDEEDHTKLKVSTWSNMKVTECACF